MSHPTAYPQARTVADFTHNLREVGERIEAALQRAGREPGDVRLLPVSKTVDEDRLRLAAAAGRTMFGENKVQEAKRKWRNLSDLDVQWSVIGHLQTNKAKDVAEFAAEFQALDNARAAQALDRRLQTLGRSLDVFVQVNTSGEDSKYGLAPDDVIGFLRTLPNCSALRVRGLMTIAVLSSDVERIRPCFALLRKLRDHARELDVVGRGELSMGMSGDYEVAIEEGATCVRVGQAIFGARATPDSHYWPASQ
ncbi:pyridoxal phosphate biosynthesis protein [Mycolicibacterium wolinskyi]|uniref:Pyridoxal phosphate homeostasis protein n=1 Tax=Mycolicibacterium wolinskyi TaxID=59750 RepID=A0A132PE29_9MYCO|nr:YggS family pyridoxal phosphate-dependent enzyme [Mycolicibacterium wolinskyi]KWX20596.1 pyridoxal phosphate biosynthesis protein [Mycolicibacterium wolinskyi]